MSAIPKEFLQKAASLSAEATRPFPGARKIYVQGSRPDLRVGMREVRQTPTRGSGGAEENPPIYIYDTSGPYTDPSAQIDLMKGLPPLRRAWILERGDTQELADWTSAYSRQRHADPEQSDAHLHSALDGRDSGAIDGRLHRSASRGRRHALLRGAALSMPRCRDAEVAGARQHENQRVACCVGARSARR